jgi:hypothetical protein
VGVDDVRRHSAILISTYITALILCVIVGGIALFAIAWQRGSQTFLELDGGILTVLLAGALWKLIYAHLREGTE